MSVEVTTRQLFLQLSPSYLRDNYKSSKFLEETCLGHYSGPVSHFSSRSLADKVISSLPFVYLLPPTLALSFLGNGLIILLVTRFSN